MGFDAGYNDGLRNAIRGVIGQSATGSGARINLDGLSAALLRPAYFPASWKAFQCIENHDLIDAGHQGADRQPRIPALADGSNSRSWYARSRSRVATGLLLTAPGIPMIFMGQEFLEDKPWTDNPHAANLMIWWAGLEGLDKNMSDHQRFTRDLIWLRRNHPALRGEAINVFHVHNENRVIAFHRWLEGIGGDVVVVASLNENTFYDYSYVLGFPGDGHWNEVFNSDIYDNFFNPNSQGNYGGIFAKGPGMHNLPSSAGITIPANSILVFARDTVDR
jgi:1,4-alpha-glucan branching enzyme